MKTRYLMMSSAIVMAVIGLILTFMPEEILQSLGQQKPFEISVLVLQLMGALYFGFAIINWTAKDVLIGGIYAKPLSLGNFMNFMIGAISLLKLLFSGKETGIYLWILAIIYLIFAIAFGFVSFRNPLKSEN